MRSAAQEGGHEWLEAVPSDPRLVIEPVAFLHALRHYMGLHPFGGGGCGDEPGEWPRELPQTCRCDRGRSTVAAHATSCNVGAAANERHNAVRAVWNS